MADQKFDKETANDIDLLQDVIGKALKAGADAADAVLVEGTSLSHARRLGKTEKLERSEGQDLGLRVLVGKQQAIVSSNGFAGGYSGSHHAISASVIGGSGNAMERDYDFANSVYGADLCDPAEIGRSAGERTIRRLGARKMPTCRCPVVFDPRVARSFISHFLGSISGPSIARGTSFLRDKLHQRIFPEAITITEDPHRQRGHRSKPFDAEGIANQRRALIDKGVLTTWLLDPRSARQARMKTK